MPQASGTRPRPAAQLIAGVVEAAGEIKPRHLEGGANAALNSPLSVWSMQSYRRAKGVV
jgi:hypothetical protein